MLRVSEGSVAVRSLVLGIPGTPQPKVELPEVDVGSISADAFGRTARVEAPAKDLAGVATDERSASVGTFTTPLAPGGLTAASSGDGAFDRDGVGAGSMHRASAVLAAACLLALVWRPPPAHA